ncbi:enoyl-CoA hydratase/isomerase family protein [uncultured Ralstonia sp.]|jgi:enoyl-CoA hydratase/carnithine racemase|uniref:enoyl-CoA hydratase/isomerase family protein n=1 Tax=Ralstonia sp. TaxID=54061 RepID=UPI001EA7AEBA|nr:enoyl-CoA hydratase/isomerase family protein [uncultured Ralstonia sp.]UCF25788.1 MAG: enoyl-CoA hydratase/isomerase family protein [Ralstonia sp.]
MESTVSNLPHTDVQADVIAEVRGGIGWLTLNRPQALNALSLEMIRALSHALMAWQHDPEVHAVILRGEGGKALCAGGDIRFFHRAATAGDPQLITFFTEEYRLNHLIFQYAKPYIALMDGVVMGGGMGISQGASLRVVTERTRMAMPETNIGLFPDVGGGWFLARVPGHVGEYLGVTGQMIEAADGLSVGLADCHVTTQALAAIVQRLHDGDWQSAEQIVACFTEAATEADAAKAVIAPHRAAIDACFGAATVPAILAELAGCADADWAAQTAQHMAKRSPLMMAVTLEQIRRGRHTTLADELRRELDMMTHVFAEGDGIEGIRALAVDKDHAPKWRHASVDAVRDDEVAAFFVSPWRREAHPLLGLSD